MKIDSNKLLTFFSKATLNANIQTALVKIENKQMNIWVRSSDNTTAVNATLLNVDAEDQSWAIKDTKMFLSSLKLFSGQIELIMNENKLSMFNADRQVDFVLAGENFIDNALSKKPSLDYEKTATISSAIFKNTLKNKSVVKAGVCRLISDGKSLHIMSGDKNFDTITEKIVSDLPEAEVNLSTCADVVFENLDEKVEVGIKSDYPVQFRFSTPDYEIQYVVAHIVPDEE